MSESRAWRIGRVNAAAIWSCHVGAMKLDRGIYDIACTRRCEEGPGARAARPRPRCAARASDGGALAREIQDSSTRQEECNGHRVSVSDSEMPWRHRFAPFRPDSAAFRCSFSDGLGAKAGPQSACLAVSCQSGRCALLGRTFLTGAATTPPASLSFVTKCSYSPFQRGRRSGEWVTAFAAPRQLRE